jgi:hypothetical protein
MSLSGKETTMSDEELIARLRDLDTWVETADVPDLAADRIEQLAATNEALVNALAKAVDFIEDLEGHEWPLDVQAKRILAEIRGANDRRYMHRRYMGQIMAECDCPCEAECLAAERCAALKGDDKWQR